MKINEVTNNLFYHGSNNYLPVGTILTGGHSDGTELNQEYQEILIQFKPNNMLHFNNAVYMVDNVEDVGNAIGDPEYLFIVKPLGKVERHDMSWATELEGLLDNPKDNENTIEQYAYNYWNGIPSSNPVFEYFTTKAEILYIAEEEEY